MDTMLPPATVRLYLQRATKIHRRISQAVGRWAIAETSVRKIALVKSPSQVVSL